MTISKTLSTLSLALALFGGAAVIAPSQVEAADHISYDALKKNQAGKKDTRPGQPANKYNRGCSAITRCRG